MRFYDPWVLCGDDDTVVLGQSFGGFHTRLSQVRKVTPQAADLFHFLGAEKFPLAREFGR